MKTGSKPESYYISLGLKRVEDKLGWGSSDQWSHADFLEVSEKISEETRINLSVTTIKRLWGKVNYTGTPSVNTLNAIALFLGYENWRTFKIEQDEKSIEKPAEKNEKPELLKPAINSVREERKNSIPGRGKVWMPLLATLFVIALAFLFYSAKEKENTPVINGAILFNSEPVASGIPNTVVFNYDLSAIDFDSAFIQQNWDPRRRERIRKENKKHTSVYYFPGHFNAKLVVNGTVVKEHGLLIPTEGWLGIVEREGYSLPVYIKPENLVEAGALHASPEFLESQKIDTGKDYGINYINTQDFGVDGDNFTLSASVKNDLDEGAKVCQEMMVFIDGEKGVMWFPLSAPGCVGNLSLNFSEVNVNGKNHDLSAFGTDLSRWNDLQLTVKNKKVELLLNGEMIYTGSYQEPIGKVMGINFKFHGAGAVDNVRLRNKNQEVVYEDDFEPGGSL